jgi:serum amyloid A protein
VRLSYGRDPQARNEIKILEENHYYPYGLKHTNYNANLNAYKKDNNDQVQLTGTGLSADLINKYKFNGCEYQDELGLNLYDMDMRDYDPAIGRWTGIDPVTHFPQSPYNAFDGNPVTFADPSGADGIVYGMAGQSAWSNPNPRGIDTFGNANYMPDSFADNIGAGWGDGGLLATSTRVWVPGSGPDTPSECTVYAGHWETTVNIDIGRIDPPSKRSISREEAGFRQLGRKMLRAAEFTFGFAGGVKDFVVTYNEMKNANWLNSDKYFHSKANFLASQRGAGGQYAAEKMSNLREITDQIKGDTYQNSVDDQKANMYGRQQAQKLIYFSNYNFSFKDVLPKFRPSNLPNQY